MIGHKQFLVTSYGDGLEPAHLERLRTAVKRHLDELEARRVAAMIPDDPADAGKFYGRYADGGEKSAFSLGELKKALAYDDTTAARYLRYRYRFAVYPGRKKLLDYPLVVVVEPSSICNLRCRFCFICDPRLSANPAINGRMSLDTFDRIVAEAAEHRLDSLVVTGRGEPTLNPHLGEMLLRARKAGILDIKLNTNALKLDERLARQVLDADPDLVVFSVDSPSQEVYQRLRRGSDFQKVVRNITRFGEILRRHYPHNRTVTRVSMVVTEGDQDVAQAEAFWQDKVDEFACKGAHQRLNLYDRTTPADTTPCALLHERVYVWWDGTVNPCDNDYLSHLTLGRLGPGTSLSSLWLGPKMQHLREMHHGGRKDQVEVCRLCDAR